MYREHVALPNGYNLCYEHVAHLVSISRRGVVHIKTCSSELAAHLMH